MDAAAVDVRHEAVSPLGSNNLIHRSIWRGKKNDDPTLTKEGLSLLSAEWGTIVLYFFWDADRLPNH